VGGSRKRRLCAQRHCSTFAQPSAPPPAPIIPTRSTLKSMILTLRAGPFFAGFTHAREHNVLRRPAPAASTFEFSARHSSNLHPLLANIRRTLRFERALTESKSCGTRRETPRQTRRALRIMVANRRREAYRTAGQFGQGDIFAVQDQGSFRRSIPRLVSL
jgi:hypothetical protein